MIKEGNELVTNCNQLKLKAADGKRRLTDVANTEQLLRIIQSIPSKKAEPFKLWLAQVGRERIDETMDPELIAERLITTYERKGYTREWINQRLQAISARKELTDEWKDKGIKGQSEYACRNCDKGHIQNSESKWIRGKQRGRKTRRRSSGNSSGSLGKTYREIGYYKAECDTVKSCC